MFVAASTFVAQPARRLVDAPLAVSPLIADITTEAKHLLPPELLNAITTGHEGGVDAAGRCVVSSLSHSRSCNGVLCVLGMICRGTFALSAHFVMGTAFCPLACDGRAPFPSCPSLPLSLWCSPSTFVFAQVLGSWGDALCEWPRVRGQS